MDAIMDSLAVDAETEAEEAEADAEAEAEEDISPSTSLSDKVNWLDCARMPLFRGSVDTRLIW